MLARQYGTTVPAIMALNPGIEPLNLQIGSVILICQDGKPMPPCGSKPPQPPMPKSPMPEPPMCPDKMLHGDMRTAWMEHVFWTRLLLISIAERMADQSDTTARLLRNPDDIARIFARYYPAATAKMISQLLTEHLQIGAKLITALRDKKTAEADKLNFKWYMNADKMADAFAGMNPYYDREELRKMLYSHLQLTTDEVAHRLAGDYAADVAAMDKVQAEALDMADYFTAGIMEQFPERFM